MMDNEVRLDHPLPDDVLDAARTLYAAPNDAAYWTSMEARVMSRISQESGATKTRRGVRMLGGGIASGREWWQVVNSWSRVGMAAAAAILLAMGALLMRSHADEIRSAYDTITKPTPAETLMPKGALGEREGSDSRDATFRDVITR